jgi:hypothetical protein
MRNDLTAAQVREQLDYDPAAGVFTWKKNPRPWGKNHIGQRAGYLGRNGYRYIRLFGVLYLGHRLAWLCVNEVWPEGALDHKNRQRDDNRIENLHPATRRENNLNAKLAPNKTGYRGVYWQRGRTKPFYAQLKYHHQKIFLGSYATAEDAHAAVLSHVQNSDPDFVDPALWVYR